MATIDRTRELEPDQSAPIGWEGLKLAEMLALSEGRFEETGYYHGLRDLAMKDSDPLHFEKLFSRVRGGMVTARETALNISASPIVREQTFRITILPRVILTGAGAGDQPLVRALDPL